MITNVKELAETCEKALLARGYHPNTLCSRKVRWRELLEWMQSHSISEFNEKVAEQYCTEAFGMYYLVPNTPEKTQRALKAIRCLVSLQQYGDLESKSPYRPKPLTGPLAKFVQEYLNHCKEELAFSSSTLACKETDLRVFCKYADENSMECSAIGYSQIIHFFQAVDLTESGRHRLTHNVRTFLRYLYEKGHLEKDLSCTVPKSVYRDEGKLPSVYRPEEIRRILEAVDRTTAFGKRDYLVLVLASQYGLRASDICSLRIGEVDWDHNRICHVTSKTGEALELPLTAPVGNAIYDYLQNSRPKSPSDVLVVSFRSGRKGLSIQPKTIAEIVGTYIAKANIENWKNRKHGSHALRHSVATQLLENGTPFPVIGSVLGHATPKATATYAKVGITSLRKCALQMPILRTTFYADVKKK